MDRALRKLDVTVIKKGGRGKHDKIISPITGKKAPIPRKINLIPGITKNICVFLLEQGHMEEDIKKALKIK